MKNTFYSSLRNFLLTFILLLCVGFLRAQSTTQTISSIDDKGSWYYIYDEKGKKITTLSKNIGKVEGYGSNWFVVSTKSWIYLYDIKGRKYKTFSVSSIGEVVSVGSNTFTTRKGSWLYTFDNTGKKNNTRSAR